MNVTEPAANNTHHAPRTTYYASRNAAWARFADPWDLIIIGGGITGAGILALAARMGLRALLLEQNDFASGTSSRSSKLVHGGLRYLKQMQFKLTRESVHERQYLLGAAPGLVHPLNFIYPVYAGDRPGAWMLELGLGMYTRMGGAGGYEEIDAVDLLMLMPGIKQPGFETAYVYADAQTDDARLVLRVLQDALHAGAGRCLALNYARVAQLLRAGGRVVGVGVQDQETGREGEALAGVVINAAGAWVDDLRSRIDRPARIRPLRGSHLFFPPARFPIYQAVAMLHPEDGRPVFAYPWEGVVLLGTTDVDHPHALDHEPRISAVEQSYLLAVANHYFPDLGLSRADIISTQAGVRPVIDTGKEDPSKEHRDHVIWAEEGLLTVTGGKLTTFRLIAHDALRAARELHPALPKPEADLPVFETPAAGDAGQAAPGRYGHAAAAILALPGAVQTPLPGTRYRLAELLWSAANESVRHLDDLFLRRFRLGILRSDGGLGLLPDLRPHLQPALGWEDARWLAEVDRYRRIWQQAHGVEPWPMEDG